MILLPLEICERVFCLGRQGILNTGDQSLIKDALRFAFRLVCSCDKDQSSPDAFVPQGVLEAPRSRSSLSLSLTKREAAHAESTASLKMLGKSPEATSSMLPSLHAALAYKQKWPSPIGTATLVLGNYFRLISSSGNAVPCQAHRGR